MTAGGRKHRRIAAGWLHQKAVDGYTLVLDREATDMIQCLLRESQNGTKLVNPQPHAGRCSLNNMLAIVFGTRTISVSDPLVAKALRLSREFMNCTGPVSNLVDFSSLLQRLPTRMRKRGRKLHDDLVDTYGGMIFETERQIRLGRDVPECLAKTMLSIRDEEELDDLDMAILASAFMIGGVETTASIMQWFSALIPSYPHVQRRAQEELDKVIGKDRLPNVDDEANLPYCHAIVKEIERCHNPFWLGTPHVASEDFTYQGQFIPQGTVCVLNTWIMHHDPERYPDPMAFKPERFLHDPLSSAQSSNLPNPLERDHWMFGAGRRICPGMWVAEREIWLTVSRMLWAFEMEASPDHPIDLKEYDGLSGRSPVPFQVYLKPRHENVERVLLQSASGISGTYSWQQVPTQCHILQAITWYTQFNPSPNCNSPFFKEFLYALSSLMFGSAGLTPVVTSALFVQETLPGNKNRSDTEVGAGAVRHRASTSRFSELLSRYDSLIRSISLGKAPKAGQPSLLELDEYRYGVALETFRSDKPRRQMEHDDVKKLVDWKLRHGKFRPTLMKLVSSNDEETVKKTIQEAMAQYWLDNNVTKAIDAIAKLRGIGPATASLLLSVHDPDRVIFFSDEAYWWLCCGGQKPPIKYNAKEYQQLNIAAGKIAKRLQVGATDIERVAYVVMKDDAWQSPHSASEPQSKASTEKAKVTSLATNKALAKRKSSSAIHTDDKPTRRSQRRKIC
ncbi:hypothetical protein CHU98_g10416 [Xylaria longipes]|nr:hypothetical protein CHU98_g10416 [Xylaria longipes]